MTDLVEAARALLPLLDALMNPANWERAGHPPFPEAWLYRGSRADFGAKIETLRTALDAPPNPSTEKEVMPHTDDASYDNTRPPAYGSGDSAEAREEVARLRKALQHEREEVDLFTQQSGDSAERAARIVTAPWRDGSQHSESLVFAVKDEIDAATAALLQEREDLRFDLTVERTRTETLRKERDELRALLDAVYECEAVLREDVARLRADKERLGGAVTALEQARLNLEGMLDARFHEGEEAMRERVAQLARAEKVITEARKVHDSSGPIQWRALYTALQEYDAE